MTVQSTSGLVSISGAPDQASTFTVHPSRHDALCIATRAVRGFIAIHSRYPRKSQGQRREDDRARIRYGPGSSLTASKRLRLRRSGSLDLEASTFDARRGSNDCELGGSPPRFCLLPLTFGVVGRLCQKGSSWRNDMIGRAATTEEVSSTRPERRNVQLLVMVEAYILYTSTCFI